MSVSTATFDEMYALYAAMQKAEYDVGRFASGAQMPGEAVADNPEYAAEVDAKIAAVTSAAAAVSVAGDQAVLDDGDVVDVDGADYTVNITDGVVTYTAVV